MSILGIMVAGFGLDSVSAVRLGTNGEFPPRLFCVVGEGPSFFADLMKNHWHGFSLES